MLCFLTYQCIKVKYVHFAALDLHRSHIFPALSTGCMFLRILLIQILKELRHFLHNLKGLPYRSIFADVIVYIFSHLNMALCTEGNMVHKY